MQTVLAYFAARRRQMITVCALSLLLVMHHRVVATLQYNRKKHQMSPSFSLARQAAIILLQNITLRMLSSKTSMKNTLK